MLTLRNAYREANQGDDILAKLDAQQDVNFVCYESVLYTFRSLVDSDLKGIYFSHFVPIT